jgi:predicted amidohydrolase YtcJ
MPFRKVAFAAALFTSTASIAWAQEPADRIFTGGPVLTMNDAQPRAGAVAVTDGRIVAVGTEEEIAAFRGEGTEVTDLAGRALVPGFFDAHGHVMAGGVQALTANLLAPPDGEVTDIASLQQVLRDWAEENSETVAQVGLIMGFGYDNSQLAEQRHPTRADLDAVSTEIPVFLIHQSGHIGAANSRALERLGITAASENPPGGLILKDAAGEPTGVLEENAFFAALPGLFTNVGPEGMKAILKAGGELWARYGYTTAQEGRSLPGSVGVLAAVAAEGGFRIDVMTHVDVIAGREFLLENVSADYVNRFRVAGAKLTVDGSPQGFTALRDRPYYAPVGNYPPGYLGYASVTQAQVDDSVEWAYANGVQILAHANGEGAQDMLIAAVGAATERHGAADRRTTLIHGQFAREDQVDSYKALGVIPSFFPMHTFYWGDWHRDRTVGPALADDISPTGWAVRRGMIFTSHHDAPVAFPGFDAGARRHRHAAVAVGRHHRAGPAGGRDHGAEGDDALARLPVFRGGPERLDRGGQARRSRDPVGRSDGGGPRDAGPACRGRDDQGRRDDLRGGRAGGAARLPAAAGRGRSLCGLPAAACGEPRHGRRIGQGDPVAGLRRGAPRRIPAPASRRR